MNDFVIKTISIEGIDKALRNIKDLIDRKIMFGYNLGKEDEEKRELILSIQNELDNMI